MKQPRQTAPSFPSFWRPLLAATVLPIVGCADAADQVAAQDESAHGATEELVVDFDDDLNNDDILALAKRLNITLTDTTEAASGNVWLYRGPNAHAVLEQLRAESDVEVVEHNVAYGLFDQAVERMDTTAFAALTEEEELDVGSDVDVARPTPVKPNDPMYKSQWHFDMVNAEGAWRLTQGDGVVVAVVDTGVSQGTLAGGQTSKFKRVPDLKETEMVPGYNFVTDTADASDGNGHGTHVAGTIAQSTNNALGVAGLAYGAKIMPIKVLSDQGSGTVADIANGIRFAADNGAKVINMSLGGGLYSATLANAVKYAHKKGVTVACAAGNGSRQKVEYPAAYAGCVAVSALGPDGKLAFYSSYGKELDIAAPGGDTRSDLNGDGIPDGVLQDTIARGDPNKHGFFPYQGTSMATPHVAAGAALVIALGVTDPDRVEAILKGTAKPLNDAIRYGAGGLDVKAATEKAHTGKNLGGAALALMLLGWSAYSAKKRDGRMAMPIGAMTVVGTTLVAGGAFFARAWMPASLWNNATEALTSGLLDAPGAFVGPSGFASVLVLNAGVVLLPFALLWGVKRARQTLTALAFGVAGGLLVRGLTGSVDVSLIPGHGALDASWLLLNGALAAGLGRLTLMRDRA